LQEATTIPLERITDADLEKLRSFGAGKTVNVNVGEGWGQSKMETHLDVEALANSIHRWGRDQDLTKTLLGELICCIDRVLENLVPHNTVTRDAVRLAVVTVSLDCSLRPRDCTSVVDVCVCSAHA